MTQSDTLWRLGVAELVAGFRAGAFTPTQALASCLARSHACQPALNALVDEDVDGAMRAAAASDARWRAGAPLGPLDGVPVTIKDNLHAAGLRTTWGSRWLADLVPDRDELPVARLRAAGAVIFGKTNVPEFTMQGYTDNLLHGPTRNPWNTALTPGGSSGGAVALVAAGGCPLALGTDGGGSIRRPASHTGLVGFKPSRGRVPRAGGLPAIFLDYEVAGPIARSVEDIVIAMQVLSLPDVADPSSSAFGGQALAVPDAPAGPLRILHVRTFADHPVDPDVAARTDAAARHLAALGHQVVTSPRFELAEAVNARWPSLSQAGLAWLAAHPDEAPVPGRPLDPQTLTAAMQASLRAGQSLTGDALFGLLFEVERLRRALSVLFADHDVLLTPAAAALPWPATESHPTTIDGREVGPRGHAIFTAFANAAGLPAIALPAGEVRGLPVGIQLVAAEGDDARLLALARQYERHHPWPRTADPARA